MVRTINDRAMTKGNYFPCQSANPELPIMHSCAMRINKDLAGDFCKAQSLNFAQPRCWRRDSPQNLYQRRSKEINVQGSNN